MNLKIWQKHIIRECEANKWNNRSEVNVNKDMKPFYMKCEMRNVSKVEPNIWELWFSWSFSCDAIGSMKWLFLCLKWFIELEFRIRQSIDMVFPIWKCSTKMEQSRDFPVSNLVKSEKKLVIGLVAAFVGKLNGVIFFSLPAVNCVWWPSLICFKQTPLLALDGFSFRQINVH